MVLDETFVPGFSEQSRIGRMVVRQRPHVDNKEPELMSDLLNVVPFKMWDKIHNIGDAVNPHILRAVSGASPIKAERGDHVLAIGSILQKANMSSYIWGTGLMHPTMRIPDLDGSRIRAVRGELTKKALRDSKVIQGDVPIGDPGYLVASHLKNIPESTLENGRASICIIPHHASVDNPVFTGIQDASVKVLDFRTQSLDVLDEIRNADVVLSQSLHGLIFAEAFGVPNAWISSKVDENWCFKFHDWFSTTASPETEPFVFKGPQIFDYLGAAKNARLHDSLIDIDALVQAFPMEVVRSIPAQGFVDFEHCRALPFSFVETGIIKDVLANSDVDDEEKARASQQVKKMVKENFRSCAETEYCIVGNPMFAREDMYSMARDIMNRKSNIQFAFLDVDEAADSVRVSGDKGGSGTVFLRPNLDFSLLSESHVTISFPGAFR